LSRARSHQAEGHEPTLFDHSGAQRSRVFDSGAISLDRAEKEDPARMDPRTNFASRP
jgi:hypothetical protein